MSGPFRLVLLAFSVFPIQRWLGVIGLLLVGVGYLVPRPVSAGLIPLGLVLPVLPLLLAGGMILRQIVSPRTIRLTPHGRAQLLAGLLAITLVIAGGITLIAWTTGLDQLMKVPAPVLFVRLEAIATLVLLSQFILSSGVPGMTMWFMLVAAVPLSMGTPRLWELLHSGLFNNDFLVCFIIVSWVIFGAWFLQTRSIQPAQDGTNLPQRRILKIRDSPHVAVQTFLLGQPTALGLFNGALMGVAFCTVAWLAVFAVTQPHSSITELMARALGPALGVAASAGAGGFIVTRRSKYLWLKGGLDRAGLFRLCEAQAWRFFVATAAPMPLLLVVAWMLVPSLGYGLALLLLFHLFAAVCLLYLGLMHVRGWPWLDIALIVGLFATWITVLNAVRFATRHPMLIPAIIAGVAIAACLLRIVALRRWQHIDWLVCRSPRPTTQADRSTG